MCVCVCEKEHKENMCVCYEETGAPEQYGMQATAIRTTQLQFPINHLPPTPIINCAPSVSIHTQLPAAIHTAAAAAHPAAHPATHPATHSATHPAPPHRVGTASVGSRC